MILIDANNWRWWRYFQLEKILHFLSSLLNNYHHILSAVSSIPSYSCYLFFLTSPQIVILRVSGLCKNPIFMMSSCFPCRSATRSKKMVWVHVYKSRREKHIWHKSHQPPRHKKKTSTLLTVLRFELNHVGDISDWNLTVLVAPV